MSLTETNIKASEEAKANPGEIVHVGGDDREAQIASFEEAKAGMADYLGLPKDDLKGWVVLGFDQDQNIMIGGNIAGGKQAVATILAEAAMQVDPDMVTDVFIGAMAKALNMDLAAETSSTEA